MTMEKKYAHVIEPKSTQELIDIYNHTADYQEQFVKEVYDELLARGADGDKLFRDRELFIKKQNKYVEQGKKVSVLEMIAYSILVLKFYSWLLSEDGSDENTDFSPDELIVGLIIVVLIGLVLSARPFYIATAQMARKEGTTFYKYTKGARIYGWILTTMCCLPLIYIILYTILS